MYALRDAGFKIALDDFGSGYSCLNALIKLPVDILKLDMKFLSMDTQDIRSGLVLSSIVRMGKLLNLVVIAEGVELQEQADFLKGIGCEYVQGFLFARPMPVVDYEKLLMRDENPLSYFDQSTFNHIGCALPMSSSVAYAIGTSIPAPLACLEYKNGKIVFLRANYEFYTEFNLSDDLESVLSIFKKHLPKKSYSNILQTLERCVHSAEKLQIPVLWNCDDGTQRKYICQIACEGSVDTTASIVVVFTNVTEEL